MEWIASTISAVISAGWKIYLAVMIASAALLLSPDPFISRLGLEEFRAAFRTYAGVVLIASASLLLVNIISGLGYAALKPWRDWRSNRVVHKTISELTEAEKEFLRVFIFENQNTVTAPIQDGIAGGLEAKRLIYRSSNVSYGFDFPYNLQPVARRILTARPDLLA
jgi:Super-infection exclusion protein B